MKNTRKIRRGAALAAACLLLLLAACGQSGAPQTAAETPTPAPQSAAPTPAPNDPPLHREAPPETDSAFTPVGEESAEAGKDIPLGELLSTNWYEQDEATKQRMADTARAAGYEIEFDDDGAMLLHDTDGTVLRQSRDGSWSIVGGEGGEGPDEPGGTSYIPGGGWPDNEYTRRVPDPGFQVVTAEDALGAFEIAFSGVTKEQAKAYAERLRESGFDRGEDVMDQSVSGMEIYMFSASDAEGYTVELAFSAGVCALTIGK